eukprot:Pgem_evm1s3375
MTIEWQVRGQICDSSNDFMKWVLDDVKKVCNDGRFPTSFSSCVACNSPVPGCKTPGSI